MFAGGLDVFGGESDGEEEEGEPEEANAGKHKNSLNARKTTG